MSPERQGSERRKHVRVRRNFIIRFYQKGNPALKYEVSQVENLSRGGVCFTSTLLFSPGEVLSVELRTPYVSETVYLEGAVLHCQPKVQGMIYQVRLKFQDVSPLSADVLEKIERYNVKGDIK